MSVLESLFVSLRVTAQIPQGGRITTLSDGQIQLEDSVTLGGWMASVRRRVTGDSRTESVRCLMQMANDVAELSDNIIDSLVMDTAVDASNGPMRLLNDNTKKYHQLNKLCVLLPESARGIGNLHVTYADDVNALARLDEVIDKLNQQHERISYVLQFLQRRGAGEGAGALCGSDWPDDATLDDEPLFIPDPDAAGL